MKKYWLISIAIPTLFYSLWGLFRLFESPFLIVLTFLFPLLILFSLSWAIYLLLKVKKLKFLLLPLLVISLIPCCDLIFRFRFIIEDLFKPQKILIAKSEGPVSLWEFTLRNDKTFEYIESSFGGTK